MGTTIKENAESAGWTPPHIREAVDLFLLPRFMDSGTLGRVTGPSGRSFDELTASVIISAHNEERTLGRLLAHIGHDVEGAQLEIIVVCNGCTDDTAAVARRSDVTVIELAEASKHLAMRRGDEVARAYPRVYLDADVEITAQDLNRLTGAVGTGRYLAAGPARTYVWDGVSRTVRWYYDVWQELPHVREGLYGRGVIVVAEEANDRIRALPPVMSDDLAMAEVVAPSERLIVPDAVVVVRPSKTLADLVRRRVRVATGNSQADKASLRRPVSRTSSSSLVAVVRRSPALLLKMPVFVGVTLAARLLARRAVRAADFTTWHRDESSRT